MSERRHKLKASKEPDIEKCLKEDINEKVRKNQIKIKIQMTRREHKSMRFPSTKIEMKSNGSKI